MTDSLDAWFKREILVHEDALTRFLRALWKRDPADIHDLRQEVYARVYEAAGFSRPASPHAFLFTAAKHLVTDRIRRERVVSIDTAVDLEELDAVVDEISPERQTMARQELRTLARAFDSLPPKCRDTVWFRRVERLSTREVAARLGITQKTVEGHLTKGLKRLADALFGNDTSGAQSPPETSQERTHG